MTTTNYLKATKLMERLYRFFLEIVKTELKRYNINDINNVQCLMIYNIGMDKDGDISSAEMIKRGYYLGSNVSYNLQKLVQHGYIIQKPYIRDRRVHYIHLSEKGQKLFDKFDEMFPVKVSDLLKYGVIDDINDVQRFCEHTLDAG